MAGMRVVVVACEPNGNIDVEDLRRKAAEHGSRLAALMLTYPSTHGVFEEAVREICDIVHRARRPGVHGRREHERAGRSDQPGGDRRGRLSLEPAQDLRDSARRWRARHGADCRGAASGALPARPPLSFRPAAARAIPAVSAAPWGSASILLISYGYIRMLGAEGRDRCDAIRDPQRELRQGPAREALRRSVRQSQRPRRARDDLRPPAVQAEADRRGRAGRGETADGLRLPRADRLVSGGRDDDGRTDGERVEGGAGSVLRRDDRDPGRDSGGAGWDGRSRKTTC